MKHAEIPLTLVYGFLLILLAYMGSMNQNLTRSHVTSVVKIQTLSDSIAHSRTQTATITAPEAVIRRAQEQEMVPATEGTEILYISPKPAPNFPIPPSGLEMRTVWR